MRGFQDRAHIQRDVDVLALPALERLAANDALLDRSRQRFEHDEPPQYESSTEPSVHGDDSQRGLDFSTMPADMKARMDGPLDDKERDRVLFLATENVAHPKTLYGRHADQEDARMSDYLNPLPPMWWDHIGSQRRGVVIRHNIKQYWEEAGMWNPAWGVPGRNAKAEDHPHSWEWWWQAQGSSTPQSGQQSYWRQLARRLVDLRRNLRRGEYIRPPPQPPLPADATASQAEAFLLSRPWVLFTVEVAEEEMRYRRVESNTFQPRYNYSPMEQVIKWWKERGNWEQHTLSSWFWPHEKDAPSWPKDLAPLDKMKHTPLDHPREIEFTPSEVDELEIIEGPKSKQPKDFWYITKGCLRPYPGQFVKPPEIKLTNGSLSESEDEPSRGGFFEYALSSEGDVVAEEPEAQKPRNASAKTSMAKAGRKPPPATQGLRRSPRIAAANKKRAAEAHPPDEAPAKRSRSVAKRGPKEKTAKQEKKEPQASPARKPRQKKPAIKAIVVQPEAKGRAKRAPPPTAEPATSRGKQPRAQSKRLADEPAATKKAAPPPARAARSKRQATTSSKTDKEASAPAVSAPAGRGRGRPRGRQGGKA